MLGTTYTFILRLLTAIQKKTCNLCATFRCNYFSYIYSLMLINDTDSLFFETKQMRKRKYLEIVLQSSSLSLVSLEFWQMTHGVHRQEMPASSRSDPSMLYLFLIFLLKSIPPMQGRKQVSNPQRMPDSPILSAVLQTSHGAQQRTQQQVPLLQEQRPCFHSSAIFVVIFSRE